MRHRLLRFSRDGLVLATTDGASHVTLWDVRSGQEMLKLHGDREESFIVELAFAKDDRRLFGIGSENSSTGERQARIWEWDATYDESLRQKHLPREYVAPQKQPAALNLYFTAEHERYGREVWRNNGTTSGTSLLRDIRPGPAGSDAHGFVEIDGIVYFVADDGSTGKELWRTDGTACGTQLVNAIAIWGKRIIIGAYRDNLEASASGLAYVYSVEDGSLLHMIRHELNHPAPAEEDFFGSAVAVSGEWIAVAAYSADVGAKDSGVVYVFHAATGALHQALKNPNPTVGAHFGRSIAIAGERLVDLNAYAQKSPRRAVKRDAGFAAAPGRTRRNTRGGDSRLNRPPPIAHRRSANESNSQQLGLFS